MLEIKYFIMKGASKIGSTFSKSDEVKIVAIRLVPMVMNNPVAVYKK